MYTHHNRARAGGKGPCTASPKEAIKARGRRANDADHYHTVANPAKGEKPGERGANSVKPAGYRPGRKSAKRRR
jgi:hypothetical protein